MASPGGELRAVVTALLERNDLVLVEGRPDTPLPKLWLGSPGDKRPPPDAEAMPADFLDAPEPTEAVTGFLDRWLAEQWLKTPLCAAVLIGGRSTRMGRPKHLLTTGGRTWLQRTVERLRQVAGPVVLVGEGAVPAALADLPRLSDVPDAAGPMAGILAAMRWAPHASWLVSACDLPGLSVDALRWLLSTRRPGVWATVPRLRGSPGVEPLLAHYDFRARPCLEDLVAAGILRPGRILGTGKAASPMPPARLAGAWTNVNTRSELRSHGAGD